jgi:hypothetical protein
MELIELIQGPTAGGFDIHHGMKLNAVNYGAELFALKRCDGGGCGFLKTKDVEHKLAFKIAVVFDDNGLDCNFEVIEILYTFYHVGRIGDLASSVKKKLALIQGNYKVLIRSL